MIWAIDLDLDLDLEFRGLKFTNFDENSPEFQLFSLRLSTFTSVSALGKESRNVRTFGVRHCQRVGKVYSPLSALEQEPGKLKTASVLAANAARKRTLFAQRAPLSTKVVTKGETLF